MVDLMVHLLDEARYVIFERYVAAEPPEQLEYLGYIYVRCLRAPGHVWYQVI